MNDPEPKEGMEEFSPVAHLLTQRPYAIVRSLNFARCTAPGRKQCRSESKLQTQFLVHALETDREHLHQLDCRGQTADRIDLSSTLDSLPTRPWVGVGPGLTVTGTTVAVFEADDRGEGSTSVMPMRAFSRATTWARSRIIETLTFSPLVCRLYETANLKCPPSTGGGPLLGELLNPRVGGTSYDIEFFASDRSGKGEVAESLRFCQRLYFEMLRVPVAVSVNCPKPPKTPSLDPVTRYLPVP
jgi:hypothetical protein